MGSGINEKKHFKVIENMMYVICETIKNQKLFLPFLLIYSLSYSCMEFIPAIVNAMIVNEFEKGMEVEKLAVLIGIVFVVMLCLNAIGTITNYQLDWRCFFSRTRFIRKILATLMNMDYEKLENPEVLDSQQKALTRTCGSNSGIQGLLEISVKNIKNVVRLIFACSIVASHNILIIGILSVLTIIHFVIVDRVKQKDKKETWDVLSTKWRKINYLDNIALNFAYGKEIRIFQTRDYILNKEREENKEAHKLMTKSFDRWLKTGEINQMISILQKVILYTWLIYSVICKDLSISLFILYLQVIPSFSSALENLLDDVAETRKLSEEVNDYRYFLQLDSEKQNHSNVEKREIIFHDEDHFELKIDRVSFRYPGQESYALKDISLTIHKGTKLAIVGLNGSGKTTLIKLLMRLYEPTEGNIYINGVNIQDYTKEQYFKLFAPVFQEINVYALSILENVSMSDALASNRDKVISCVSKAELDEKVNELKKGLDTQLLKVIFEDGVDLSGGEKQKLALARALYKESKVLIFDEPTAALDAYAEYNLYKKFDEIIAGRTAIYISHRLASTRFCDEIAVFEQGKIVEYGTHDSLMKKGKIYSELFNVQAQYYQEEKKNEQE